MATGDTGNPVTRNTSSSTLPQVPSGPAVETNATLLAIMTGSEAPRPLWKGTLNGSGAAYWYVTVPGTTAN